MQGVQLIKFVVSIYCHIDSHIRQFESAYLSLLYQFIICRCGVREATLVLGTSAERRAGSNPVIGIVNRYKLTKNKILNNTVFCLLLWSLLTSVGSDDNHTLLSLSYIVNYYVWMVDISRVSRCKVHTYLKEVGGTVQFCLLTFGCCPA